MNSGLVARICKEYGIILASSSPRRYEIMHDTMGFQNIELMKPTFEENLDKTKYINDPIEYVVDTSYHKAMNIVEQLKSVDRKKLVICADTIVIGRDNMIYEKPMNKEKQLKDLYEFCFNDETPIRVVTAVTLIKWEGSDNKYKLEQFHEISNVFFDNEIPKAVIEDYVNSEDGLQVAGGFKIQGFSGILIKKIEGDYFNIVGLPLNHTFRAILMCAMGTI